MDASLVRIALGFGLMAALIYSVSASEVKDNSPKQILILASYNPGMKWEDNIISEIKLHFAMRMPSAAIRTEYMDSKRIAPDEERLEYLKGLYLQKYKDRHFDVILSADTDAFYFLLNNRDEIFPGAPVVFCGVVYFNEKMLEGKSGFTGVLESYDVKDTLALMFRLQPQTKHIIIVTDRTATGLAAKKIIDSTITEFAGNASFEYLDNVS
ncbi:MAG: hypothetical protein EHM14_05450, partial [Methanothrix sp.]